MATHCIVVPCFNEADRLDRSVFQAFAHQVKEVDLLFVNDGSRDGTLAVLRQMAEEEPGLSCLDLPENRGKAEAVRAGVREALKRDYRWVGYLDADLATPLAEWWRMARLIEEKEAVCGLGSRVLMLGRKIDRKPLRHYFGRIFATAVSLITRLPIYDSQCGAKVFAAPVARRVFERPFLSKWFFDVELLFRLKQIEGVIENTMEVPLEEWIEIGDSRLKLRDVILVPRELWRIWRNYRGPVPGNRPDG